MKRLLLFLAFAASAFGNVCTLSGTGNWSVAGTWTCVGGGVPSNTSDVALTGSFTLTVDGTTGSPSVARSVDATGFTGTLTMGSTAVLTIGNITTVPATNIALKLVSGMTFTPNAASLINFAANSASPTQTIDVGGKTLGNVTFVNNTSGGADFTFTTSFAVSTTSTLTISQHTQLHTDGGGGSLSHSIGKLVSNVALNRTIDFGSSTVTLTGTGTVLDFSTTTGLTLTAGSSIITANGATVTLNVATSAGSGLTFGTLNLTGSGVATLSATGSTFGALNRTGTAVKTDALTLGGSITVTGTHTFAGNSATNRLLVQSSVIGSQRTITNTSTSVSTWQDVDFRDIDFSSSVSAGSITGNSGDCGGNGGITFTSAATQTNSTLTSASWTWSTGSWTSRVPLPQDDVTITGGAGATARSITVDMPRAGHTLDFSAMTGTNITIVGSTGQPTVYGGVKLPTTALATFVNGIWQFEGRSGSLANGTASSMPAGGWPITMGGTTTTSVNTWGFMTFQGPGGTYQLQDKLVISPTRSILLNNGTLDANLSDVSVDAFNSSGSSTRTVKLGAGNWALNATGTVWNIAASLTVDPGTSTITITDTSSSSKTFVGSGLTYNNLTASGDNITISGTNTWNGTIAVNNSANHGNGGLKITAGAPGLQILSTMTTNGTSGAHALVQSTTTSAATLQKSGGGTICLNYLDMTWITGTPSSTWDNPTGTLSNTSGISSAACGTSTTIVRHTVIGGQ